MSLSEPSKKLDILHGDADSIAFKEVKSLGGHENLVNSVLHFVSPHNKLVSCCDDYTIRIWSTETYECLATIEEHKKPVNDVLMMNKDFFISCSADKTIRSFSISSHEQLKVIELDSYPYQLLKLTEDLFLVSFVEVLLVLSFSRFEIVKKYEMSQLGHASNPFLLSRNYPNCFYIATDARHEPVVLIDFEKDRIVKEFGDHETVCRIRALSLFTNSKNEEILIAGQTTKIFYSYNTTNPKFDTDKEINQEREHRQYEWPKGIIVCCCSLNNRYLFCGDAEGLIHIFDFSEHESSSGMKKIGTKKIFSEDIYVRYIKLIPSKGNRNIRAITSGYDYSGEIRVTRVSGIRMKEENSYEQTDLEERVHFLLHEHERIFYDQKNIMGIRMEKQGIMNIPKLLLGTK